MNKRRVRLVTTAKAAEMLGLPLDVFKVRVSLAVAGDPIIPFLVPVRGRWSSEKALYSESRVKALRARLDGMCVFCRAHPRVEGHAHCARCLRARQEYNERCRLAKSSGTMCRCGKRPALPGRKVCYTCDRRKRLAEGGKSHACGLCGKETINSFCCKDHSVRARRIDSMNRIGFHTDAICDHCGVPGHDQGHCRSWVIPNTSEVPRANLSAPRIPANPGLKGYATRMVLHGQRVSLGTILQWLDSAPWLLCASTIGPDVPVLRVVRDDRVVITGIDEHGRILVGTTDSDQSWFVPSEDPRWLVVVPLPPPYEIPEEDSDLLECGKVLSDDPETESGQAIRVEVREFRNSRALMSACKVPAGGPRLRGH